MSKTLPPRRRTPLAVASVLLIVGILFGAWFSEWFPAKENLEQLVALERRAREGEDIEASLEDYLEHYPESPNGWMLLGRIHFQSEEFEEAMSCFEKALAIDPHYVNAITGKGLLHRTQGDLEKARACYLEAIELEPRNATAYNNLVLLELVAGNHDRAVEYGEKGWAIRRDYPSLAANLAIAYHCQGEDRKKWKFYEKAEELGYPHMDQIDRLLKPDTSAWETRPETQ
jgi:tetratricopeptide (TPR) repeat protein